MTGKPDSENWWQSLRNGQCFVTNGPLLARDREREFARYRVSFLGPASDRAGRGLETDCC